MLGDSRMMLVKKPETKRERKNVYPRKSGRGQVDFMEDYTHKEQVIGITSVSLLPVETFGDLSITLLLEVLKVMVPAVLMNIYVVGLNQLYDVEIDKINKPELPLASGEFSMGTGVAIVTVASCLSFALGFMLQSPPILSALLICFLIGSTYSLDLPFLRWKRYPFLAALSILAVRALVLQTTFFVHVQIDLISVNPAQDIPDVDGDRDFGIQSFSVRLGQEKIFWFCICVLSTVYAVAVVVGATSQFNLSMLVTVLGHCILATALWLRARDTDLANKESLTSFYMFIWKLFYIEYFLIPFVPVAQDFQDQEEAREEDEAEQAYSSLDPDEDRQHHQVQREAQALAPYEARVLRWIKFCFQSVFVSCFVWTTSRRHGYE
ncbi:hypothetical protein Syun_010921 [Stephania yunnanensis]|uniref:Uncharacterized protein n=1 Tax=Stephania yunnanensis TaxID=152371 RepID=A0AAP0PI02_9MAGN